MNLLKSAQVILAILPIINSVVKEVEATVNTPKSGAQKLQLALSIIRTIYEQTNPELPFDSIVGQITSIVAAVVNFYNQIGTFVKSVKAAA